MKASNISLDNNISMLLKGPWGFGKTLAAASFALDGPVYLAYWDKKSPIELVDFFGRMGLQGQKILNNIEYDVYGAHNANEYLNKVIELSKNNRYFAVITDSVTNMTSGAVNWSLSFRDDRKNKDKLKIIPDFDEYKVETSLVTQSLDLFRTMACHVIWIAHPVPSLKIEGSGNSIKITKTNPIVTYGSKVAAIVPGNFSEIYHFGKSSDWNATTGKSTVKYIVSTDSVGDDYAKSNIGLTGDIDITNQLFYEVWKAKVKLHKEELKDAIEKQRLESDKSNPFANVTLPTSKPADSNSPVTTNKAWNSETGAYE